MDRKELKKLIPHGKQKAIAAQVGVSSMAVSNFLNGKSNSHQIEKAVIEMAIKLKEEKESLYKRLKEVL